MFQRRIQEKADIHMHEIIYPILQGYDSVELQSDLTIVGGDQLFNEMLGRYYQEKFGQRPQVIITTKITPGLDGGEKQSKSLGNYIGLAHSPRDKFGRVMTLPDNLIVEYLKVYTDVPMEKVMEIEEKVATDPNASKKFLAREIVARYHGQEAADEEQAWFEKTFSTRIVPDDIPEVAVSADLVIPFELVKQFYAGRKSNSDIRRLFEQGAVSLDSEKVVEAEKEVKVSNGSVIKIGKRTWFKIKI